MIRAPLNVIPAWIVQLLQTGVSLNRIAVYLDEDEVPPQISSLKRSPGFWKEHPELTGENAGSGLGITGGAVFKWNEVEEKKDEEAGKKGNGDDKKKGKGKQPEAGSQEVSPSRSNETGSSATATATDVVDVEAARGADDAETETASVTNGVEQKFELRDVDVMFPEGELTVVTGPTASGKTALLVRFLGLFEDESGRLFV